MTGFVMLCVVCETPDDDRPNNGVNEFDALFGHIIRRHSKGFICYSGFQPWEYSSLYRDYGDEVLTLFSDHQLGLMCPVADFIDLLPHVSGFDTDYWLFPSALTSNPKMVELSTDRGPSTSYPVDASHMFANVDGAYWAFYTDRRDDLESVEQIWHRTERFEARSVLLPD